MNVGTAMGQTHLPRRCRKCRRNGPSPAIHRGPAQAKACPLGPGAGIVSLAAFMSVVSAIQRASQPWPVRRHAALDKCVCPVYPRLPRLPVDGLYEVMLSIRLVVFHGAIATAYICSAKHSMVALRIHLSSGQRTRCRADQTPPSLGNP